MKAIQDVSLQSLFVEIEVRYGKQAAEDLKRFYQGISGSHHALALLEEAEMYGEKLSLREAARRSGVSHTAVEQLRNRKREKQLKQP